MKQIIFLISFLFSVSLVGQRTQVATTVMGGDTVLYKATYHDVYVMNVDSTYDLDTSIMIHFDAEYPRPFPDTIEHALTFANGVTRTGNFVRNDLITGKSGGQTVVGGTASGDDLTISSTTNGTKGNINFGTSTYDEVNNYLGVNDASPISQLSVVGTTRLGAGYGYGDNWIPYADGNNYLRANNHIFADVSATEYMRLTSDGKLGINITNPSQSLTVSSPTTYEGILVKGNVAPNISFVQNAGTTPAYKVGLSGNDGTALSISSGAAATDLVHIKSDGKVGIGTTSPTAKLHALLGGSGSTGPTGTTIIGQNSAAGQSSYLTLVGAYNAEAGIVFTDESIAYKGKIGYNNSTEDLYFNTNGTEKMRVLSSGNVGIGTTSPSAKLDVQSSTGQQAVFSGHSPAGAASYNGDIRIGSNASYQGQIYYDGGAPTSFILNNVYNNSGSLIKFQVAGSDKMAIKGDGNVGIGTTSPTQKLDVVGNIALSGDIKSTGKVGAGTASPDRTLHTIDATALTNTVTYPLRVSHATSGTPAISFGVGIESELENASGTDKVASAITTVWADPTNGTEDAQMEIALMKNGSLATGVVIDNDGNVLVTSETYGAGWSGSKEVPTKDDLYDKIEGLQAAIIGAIYPVGSLYTSTVSTNPGTVLGVGTWVAFGAGRVMVGIDAGQSEFDTVEETGGAKTHTLTVDEMPAHTHTISSTTADGGGTNIVDMGVTASGSVTTGSAGGGASHNNLQPYIVVYMFKRTS